MRIRRKSIISLGILIVGALARFGAAADPADEGCSSPTRVVGISGGRVYTQAEAGVVDGTILMLPWSVAAADPADEGCTSKTVVASATAEGCTSKTVVASTADEGCSSKTLVANPADEGCSSKTLVANPVDEGCTSKTLVANPADEGCSSPTQVIAITGGQVYTQAEAGVIAATILIVDGVIKEVGPDVTVPDGARRIDARGMIVTPGLIDARSSLFLTPGTQNDQNSSGSLQILDAVDIYDDVWEEVVSHGITAVGVQPTAPTLAGRGAVLSADRATTISELLLARDSVLHGSLAVPDGAAASKTRDARFKSIKSLFEKGKKYGEEWDKYREAMKKKAEEKKPAKGKEETKPKESASEKDGRNQDKATTETLKRGEQRGRQQRGREEKKEEPTKEVAKKEPPKEQTKENSKEKAKEEKELKEPKFHKDLDFIHKVLKREVPLCIEAHTAEEVRHALALADEFKVRLIIEGATYAHEVEKELAGRNVPYVLGPMLGLAPVDAPASAPTVNLPSGIPYSVYVRMQSQTSAPAAPKPEEKPPEWPTSVTKHDPVWALGTFGSAGRDTRLLRFHAAVAVTRGVASADVLKAMTIGAAKTLGVADKIGSIEAGKRADIAIFKGDPTDPAAATRAVLVGGRVVFENEKAGEIEPAVVCAKAGTKANLAGLPDRYALKSARVLDASGKFTTKTLLIADGKITAVGASIEVPAGFRLFDLGDAVVTPGLINAHADLGLGGQIDEVGESDASYVRAADAFFLPTNNAARELRKQGFLNALLAPGGRNVLAGACAVVRLADAGDGIGTNPIIIDNAGHKLALADSARLAERYPVSLFGQVELLTSVLSGKSPELYIYHSARIKAELDAQRIGNIGPVRDGKLPAFIAAQNNADIRAALGLIDRFKLKSVLIGPEKLELHAAQMKKLGVGIVARPEQLNEYDLYLKQIVNASREGVPVAFGMGAGDEIRRTAARAVSLGMARDAALRGLTSDAALLLGATGRIGQLAKSYPADLIIWDGSPLDLRAKVIQPIVAGKALNE